LSAQNLAPVMELIRKVNNISFTFYFSSFSIVDNSYWRITTDDKGKKGLVFFAITNKVSSFLTSFSIQAFYVTIVLVIGNVVRNALSGNQKTDFLILNFSNRTNSKFDVIRFTCSY